MKVLQRLTQLRQFSTGAVSRGHGAPGGSDGMVGQAGSNVPFNIKSKVSASETWGAMSAIYMPPTPTG